MKIALCDMHMAELEQYKQSVKAVNEDIQIDCYKDSYILFENLLDYDMIFLSKAAIERFIYYLVKSVSKKICFDDGKEKKQFNVDEIYFIEANLKKIYMRKRETEVVINYSISKAEELLSKYDFIKTHRSYLVNLHHIKTILNNRLILDNGVEIPVSKYRIHDVKARFLAFTENRNEEDAGDF